MNSYLNDELMEFLIEEEDLENVAGGAPAAYCYKCGQRGFDTTLGICWICEFDLLDLYV